MFLTKVGLLQKERKQNDARLSAPGPGMGGLGAEMGMRAAPRLHPAGKEDPPCHLWWPSLLVLVLVDSPDGSLDVLHAHEALVQAQVVADGVLRAERAGELSGTALTPLPGPLLFLPILLLAQLLWVPMAPGCPGHARLVYSQMLCKATRGCCKCRSLHQHRENLGVELPSCNGTQPHFVDLGQMPRKMGTA